MAESPVTRLVRAGVGVGVAVTAAVVLGGCACTDAICSNSLIVALDGDGLTSPGIYRVDVGSDREASCTFRITGEGVLDIPVGCGLIIGTGAVPTVLRNGSNPILPPAVDPFEEQVAPVTWVGESIGRRSGWRPGVDVRIQRDNQLLVEDRFAADWDHQRPNGPMCGGDCRVGLSTAELDAEPTPVEPLSDGPFAGWDCLGLVGADDEGGLRLGPLSVDAAARVELEVENVCTDEEVGLTALTVLDEAFMDLHQGLVPAELFAPATVGPGERLTLTLDGTALPLGESTWAVVLSGTVQPQALVAAVQIEVVDE